MVRLALPLGSPRTLCSARLVGRNKSRVHHARNGVSQSGDIIHGAALPHMVMTLMTKTSFDKVRGTTDADAHSHNATDDLNVSRVVHAQAIRAWEHDNRGAVTARRKVHCHNLPPRLWGDHGRFREREPSPEFRKIRR